jgi:hypothetical protein
MAGGIRAVVLDLEKAGMKIGLQEQIIRAREHGLKFI